MISEDCKQHLREAWDARMCMVAYAADWPGISREAAIAAYGALSVTDARW